MTASLFCRHSEPNARSLSPQRDSAKNKLHHYEHVADICLLRGLANFCRLSAKSFDEGNGEISG